MKLLKIWCTGDGASGEIVLNTMVLVGGGEIVLNAGIVCRLDSKFLVTGLA